MTNIVLDFDKDLETNITYLEDNNAVLDMKFESIDGNLKVFIESAIPIEGMEKQENNLYLPAPSD